MGTRRSPEPKCFRSFTKPRMRVESLDVKTCAHKRKTQEKKVVWVHSPSLHAVRLSGALLSNLPEAKRRRRKVLRSASWRVRDQQARSCECCSKPRLP